MENTLNVSVSPRTYKLIAEDENYRRAVGSQVLASQDLEYNDIIFTPVEAQGTNEQEKEPEEAGSCMPSPLSDVKQYWYDSATKLMLSLMEELRPKLGKSIRVKNKNKMYKIASEEMEKQGYKFSAKQIENKFRGLERQYKKMTLNNKQTGRNRQTCSFESELSKILTENRAITPDFVLDSGDVEGIYRLPEFDEGSSDLENLQKDDGPSCSSYNDGPSCSSSNDGPSCSTSAAKKKRQISFKEQLLKELKEMRQEKKEHRETVFIFMKEIQEERDKRAARRLELLEMLVKKYK